MQHRQLLSNQLLDNIVPRAPIHTTAINILNAGPVYAARVLDPRSDLSWNVRCRRSGRHESFVYHRKAPEL